MSRVGEEEERVRAGQWECGIRMRVGVMATKGGEGREGRQERDEKRSEEKRRRWRGNKTIRTIRKERRKKREERSEIREEDKEEENLFFFLSYVGLPICPSAWPIHQVVCLCAGLTRAFLLHFSD